jgi:hypothetical protein
MTHPPPIKVLKAVDLTQNRVNIPSEVITRDFLVDFRRALLQQLRVVEKQLRINRRCKHCGQEPS